MHGASQYRVAKGTGRHGLQLPVALIANRLRRFVENEELEFRGGADGVSRLRGPLQHTPQHPSRTDRFRAPCKLAQKKHGFRLERNVALSRWKDPHRRIRIGGMPAGKFRVVVQLIVRIPAQNHIAKSEILLKTRQELVPTQILSAHDPVGVEDADLYVLNAAFGQQLNDIGVLFQRLVPHELKLLTGLHRLIVRDCERLNPRIWITSITLFEARLGLALLPGGRRRQALELAFEQLLVEDLEGRVLDFDRSATEAAAGLAAERQQNGRTVDMRDTQIAGIVIARRAALATRNVKRFADLTAEVVNPWEAKR